MKNTTIGRNKVDPYLVLTDPYKVLTWKKKVLCYIVKWIHQDETICMELLHFNFTNYLIVLMVSEIVHTKQISTPEP